MYRALPALIEPLEELERKLSQCGNAYQNPRVHLLVLLKRGEVSNRQEAARRLAYHRHTIAAWLSEYEQRGLVGLLEEGQPGRAAGVRKLPPEALERRAERLQDEPGLSGYQEAQQWLEAEYGQPIPYRTVHEWVRYRLQAKLKRPRPNHPQKTWPRVPGSVSGSNGR